MEMKSHSPFCRDYHNHYQESFSLSNNNSVDASMSLYYRVALLVRRFWFHTNIAIDEKSENGFKIPSSGCVKSEFLQGFMSRSIQIRTAPL